ncbi:tetratricopeptide repeat protein 32-like isoform X2 [Stegodyphus dumicola]|nr:tetratricopeptide repeat protein 32-like isoform X2 [Stegodyphus dumicola]
MDLISDLNKSQQFMNSRNYDDAETLLVNIISLLERKKADLERDQILAKVYNFLGLVLYKKVEFDRAVSFYDKAIQMNNSLAAAYYNRGTIRYRLGFYDDAVSDMEKAVKIEPENVEFKFGLNESLLTLKHCALNADEL